MEESPRPVVFVWPRRARFEVEGMAEGGQHAQPFLHPSNRVLDLLLRLGLTQMLRVKFLSQQIESHEAGPFYTISAITTAHSGRMYRYP